MTHIKSLGMSSFKKILGFVVVFLAAFFIIRILLIQSKQIEASLSHIRPENIILSIVMFFVYFYARAISWNLLLKSLGSHLKLRDSLFAWFAGESTRYIPGNLWSFASRFYLSSAKGVQKANIILSMMLEVVVLLPVSLFLSLPAFWANYQKMNLNIYTIIIITLIVVSVFMVFLFSNRVKQLVNKLHTIPVKVFTSKVFLGAIIFQLIAWTTFGLGNYFLIRPFATHTSIVLLVSIAIFAWFIGYVSIVTPMGLGVREGAIILLLGTTIGSGQASLAAILSRVILTGVEGVNLLYWLYLYQRRKKQHE